ncbi:MAG: flagellar motor protein MotB [Thermodesulfovibrionales bacterium]|nr:flagellar motor protein MotB [Thermodesulfovibrionales bacterium]
MKDKQVIIKKIKKVSGGGHHGGSWKVAYADFVTAMMAFFLLMWLISMVAPEKRARLSTYFKHFSLFEQSGSSFMEQTSEVFSEPVKAPQNVPAELKGTIDMKPEEFKEAIKKAIEEKLGDIKDQVIVDIFEGGVRIQLVDKEGKPMFDLGSSKLTSLGARILPVIADQVKSMPNPVAVEGHTDSIGYKASNYSNWELSTERALSARKELEKFGLLEIRLTRVAGYADTVPFIKEDSKDPRNRRISIILMFPQKEAQNQK